MPYAQLWRGSYRFRRRVPDHLGDVIGKRAWLEALGTSSKAEANRLVVPHIERTNQIIADAEAGNWPPVDDDRLSEIAEEWWQWFLKGLANASGLLRVSTTRWGYLVRAAFPSTSMRWPEIRTYRIRRPVYRRAGAGRTARFERIRPAVAGMPNSPSPGDRRISGRNRR